MVAYRKNCVRSLLAIVFSVPLGLSLSANAQAPSEACKAPAIAQVVPIAPQKGMPMETPAAAIAPAVSSASPFAKQPVSVPTTAQTTVATIKTPSVIFIDNDDAEAQNEVQETYRWQQLPDSADKTMITTGARFPVRVVSELSSKTAKPGDPVEAQVRVDLRIGGRLIAAKGSRVVGHVFDVMPARRLLIAEVSPHRWWRANGTIGIQFDQIITDDGQHIPLDATPAQQARIVINKAEGRVMGVNHKGEVASPLSIQLKEQAIHLAIRSAASVGGVFSMGAVPVAYAALGAINPSFAFMHPVGLNVQHRRLKGAAMGFISGVPGGFLIADSVIKGAEASIKPGDEFLVEFKEDFTGEPSTDAEMMAGGSKSVHGEIVKKRKRPSGGKTTTTTTQPDAPGSVSGT